MALSWALHVSCMWLCGGGGDGGVLQSCSAMQLTLALQRQLAVVQQQQQLTVDLQQ